MHPRLMKPFSGEVLHPKSPAYALQLESWEFEGRGKETEGASKETKFDAQLIITILA